MRPRGNGVLLESVYPIRAGAVELVRKIAPYMAKRN